MKENLLCTQAGRWPGFGRLVAAVCLVLLCASVASAQTAGRQFLQGHVPQAIASLHLQPTGSVAASQQLKLTFSLPLRDPEGASNLLQQIYDPASPNYHQYLTPQEFTERFGPSEQDYAQVIAFAAANHLTVTHTHPNRLLLDVRGSVADIEKTFGVTLLIYQHPVENRTFYAPDIEPSLALSVPVAAVIGLNNYTLPRPLYRLGAAGKLTAAAGLRHQALSTPNSSGMSGSAPDGSGEYFGSDFRMAYAPGTSLTGTGQSVALFECADYFPEDIALYELYAGLPNIALTNVLVDGGAPAPQTGDGVNVEVALDIEMAMAMAPGLSQILVYEGPGDTPTVDGDLLNQIANDNKAKQISSSWLIGDTSSYAAIYTQMALQGQTFLQASGDEGAYYPGIFQYEDSPLVTLVGGTTLTTKTNGVWVSEKVWNWGGGTAGGGGISTLYLIPSWQKGISMTVNQGSTSHRNVPDVALTADNIFIFADGGYYGMVGGTSAAAPLWAGFAALINQQGAQTGQLPIGFVNPAIYSIGKGVGYHQAFHDITSGNNTTPFSPSKFFAVSGYDLCTGWGTPFGTNLINALVKPADALQVTPVNPWSTNFYVAQLFNVITQNYTLTNTSGSSLNWVLVNTSAWLNASSSTGALASHTFTNVTLSLNSVAGNLPIGTYGATVFFQNVMDGVSQPRQTVLQILPLVLNGGFETGDFTSWSRSGNLTNTFVTGNSYFVHSGSYAARLGAVGSLGYLSTTLPTVTGNAYVLSFWVENPDGGLPNEFSVSWNGTAIYDQVNLPTFGWTNMIFVVTATGSSSTLQFGVRNDPEFFDLDDVSLTLNPPPTFQLLSSSGSKFAFSFNSLPLGVYQLQYTTNLTGPNWINLGSPVTAADFTISMTNNIGPEPAKFYRLQVLH